MDIDVEWIDAGREPQCPPDPAHPAGMHIKAPAGVPSCLVPLPYPAMRCGTYLVTCRRCGMHAALSTAGRPDDPRSIELPCKQPGPPTLPADGIAAAPALTLSSDLQANAAMPDEGTPVLVFMKTLHEVIRELRIVEKSMSARFGYLLPDKTVQRCRLSDLLERSRGTEMLGIRHVADDNLGPSRVSTVFLGVDHGFYEPRWFETMVFGGPHDEYMRRYETYADALAGHAETIQMVSERSSRE